MNLDRTQHSQYFLNLFGSNKVDEAAEREKIYNEAKVNWPVSSKSTCEDVKNSAYSLGLAIDQEYQSKTLDASAGNQRIRNRYIDGWTKWQNEMKAMYESMECLEVKEEQEEKEFFDTQFDNLKRAKDLSTASGNTTKYLIFGMLGVVVVISTIIIFKKD